MKRPPVLLRAWELWKDPATPEKRRLLKERWAGLDPALRLPGQGLGLTVTKKSGNAPERTAFCKLVVCGTFS